MNKFFCIVALCFLIIGEVFSQVKPVRITVRDKQNEALPGAHVLLKSISDEKQYHAVTDVNGKAFIQNVSDGLYQLKISFVGFKTLEATVKITAFARMFEYTLQSDAIALNEVTISAPKPVIRQEEDKTIVDPEPVANTTTNTMEVLESTPGLYVDQDGGVYIAGTMPAKIYINGREQKLSNQDIATILRSLPPSSVEKIEIIRSPSTKYDAATSGGIVNIVLKKGVKLGQFGSVNLGANQGIMGNRFINLNYNNSNDKLSTYVNINASRNGQFEEMNSTRHVALDTLLLQASKTKNSSNQYFLGYGATYNMTEKLSFSYDGRISFNQRYTLADNTNKMEKLNESLLFHSLNENLTQTNMLNIQQDIGSVLLLDTNDSKWEVKASFNYQNAVSEQDYTNDYLFPLSHILTGFGNNKQQRFFSVFQTDLTYQLPIKIKLETGLKASLQNLQSSSKYFYEVNWQEFPDTKKTNSYVFDENIFAAYFQASRTLFAEITVKTGVRLEHTYMKGKQSIPSDTSFLVNRSDFFPYIYLSRKIVSMMGIELAAYAIYRRTINRPGYQDLNPYIKYIDEFMYETGNPALNPQFTDNFEVNISYNEYPVFAYGKNFAHNIFSSVMYTDTTKPGTYIRTLDNLGKNNETYFRAMAGIPPGKKYFFGIGAQYSLQEYEGIYQNQPLHYKRGSWRFFTFHQLKLAKNTKLYFMGFMMTKGMWNFFELENFGMVAIGLNQTFFDQKLQVTINMRDVLKTMTNTFTYRLGSIYSYGERYADNQRVGINIRYNFGIKTKEERKLPFNDEEEIQ